MQNSYKKTEGNLVFIISSILFLVSLFWFVFGLYARTIGSHILGIDSLDGITVYSAVGLCIASGFIGFYKDHGKSYESFETKQM